MLLLPQQLVLAMVCLLSSVNMEYTLYVRVHSYTNNDTCPTCFVPNHNQTVPGCCDEFCVVELECLGYEKCDPRLFYCLRKFGTPVSLNASNYDSCGENDEYGTSSEPNFRGGDLDFSQDNLLGIPNPVPLSGFTVGWRGIQLFVGVLDADFHPLDDDDMIDRLAINIDQIPIGHETTPTLYNGTFGFASLTLSFRVECSIFHYYPNCEESGCRKDGNCTCFPGYTGPKCEFEIDECTEANCPENTICEDELNSFSCIPQTSPTVTPTVTDVHDCIGVNCSSFGRCVDGVNSFLCVCDPGYTGELCETQLPMQGCADMDCNSNGVCNATIFNCDCFTGYSGEFCQQFNSTEYTLAMYLFPAGLVAGIALTLAAVACVAIARRARTLHQQEHIYEEVKGEKKCFPPICLKIRLASETRPPLPKIPNHFKLSGPRPQVIAPQHGQYYVTATIPKHQLDTPPSHINTIATDSEMATQNPTLCDNSSQDTENRISSSTIHGQLEKMENDHYSQLTQLSEYHIYESI